MVNQIKTLLAILVVVCICAFVPLWYSIIGIAASCFVCGVDGDEIDAAKISQHWILIAMWPVIIPAMIGKAYRKEIRELMDSST